MQALMNEVLPGLFVGSFEAVRDCRSMQSIDAVLSVLKPESRERFDREACLHGKPHLFLELYDRKRSPIERLFEQAFQFIEQHRLAGHSVLVHCAAGRSRSVSLVLYYLLRKRICHSVEEALALVRKARPEADPNPGFLEKLREVERSL